MSYLVDYSCVPVSVKKETEAETVHICIVERAEGGGYRNGGEIHAAKTREELFDKVRERIHLRNSDASADEILKSLDLEGFAEYDDFENSLFTYHMYSLEV